MLVAHLGNVSVKVEFKAVGPDKVTQESWSWVSRKEERVPGQPGALLLSGSCAEKGLEEMEDRPDRWMESGG